MKIFTVAICLVAALSAHAQSLRSHIEASNARISKLMKAKDIKALTAYMKGGMTSDFKYVEAGQTQSRDQMTANMAVGLGQMKTLRKVESKLLTLKEKGNSATATTWHAMVGTMQGGDKKTHTLSFTGTSIDTYVKQGGKWKMSKMAWKEQSTKMDGKQMPGMGNGG